MVFFLPDKDSKLLYTNVQILLMYGAGNRWLFSKVINPRSYDSAVYVILATMLL